MSPTLLLFLVLTEDNTAATHVVHRTNSSDKGVITITGHAVHTSDPSRNLCVINQGHDGGKFGTAVGGAELVGHTAACRRWGCTFRILCRLHAGRVKLFPHYLYQIMTTFYDLF